MVKAGIRDSLVKRALKPQSLAQSAVRSNAASSSDLSASAKIQLWGRAIIEAMKRNKLPVPAPRSMSRGRVGNRRAKVTASTLSRAA